MVVRTKIKQKPEDVLEFEDKPSLYPKILELPERQKDRHGKRATYNPSNEEFAQENFK